MLKADRPLKISLTILIAIGFLFAINFTAFGMKPFSVKEYVTDNAGLLTETERGQLAGILKDYATKTSNQIMVVTIPSLEQEDLTDFTERLFALNKPGQKDKNNGIILFVALQEKKIRIEVGYGLEEQVPDGKAGTIIREQITPFFKANDYPSGIKSGVFALITAITPDYSLPTDQIPQRPVRHGQDRSLPGAFIIAIIIALISFLGGMRGSNSHRGRFRRGYSEPWYWGGGGYGGGGGSFGNDSGSDGSFSGGGGDFGGGGASGDW